MTEEERTPEQLEEAQYENAVKVFGERDRVLMAAEKMSNLAEVLISLIRRTDQREWARLDDWEQNTMLTGVQCSRAEAAVAMNQLDIIFPDNSEEELNAINTLTRSYIRAAEEDKEDDDA